MSSRRRLGLPGALRAPIPPLQDARALPRQQRGLAETLAEARRTIGRHRRVLAAAFAGLAVAFGLSAVVTKPPLRIAVLAAARDLQAGAVLSGSDLKTVALPSDAVPAGALTTPDAAVGRTLSGPLRRGEPLTDVRLDDGPLAPPSDGLVSTPVRLADAQAASLLRPGERVDVLAASTAPSSGPSGGPSGGGVAAVVASGVRVVAIAPPGTGNALDAAAGALVVLATTPDDARALAQAQATQRLSAVVVG